MVGVESCEVEVAAGLVEVVGLRFSFKKVALIDFNLRVRAGEIVVLAGLNGAGKTTALGLLAGLLRPQEGRVRIAGGDPLRARTRRGLFYLPESSDILPQLQAREVVRLYLNLFGRSSGRLVIEGLLQRVGLSKVARQKTSTFSKGMRRRLDLACLLASDTAVWLLDEPQSGLDPQGLRLLREICLEAKTAGRCVVMACHVLADLRALADGVVVLHEGKTLFSGELSRLGESLGERGYVVSGGDEGRTEALRASAESHGGELRGPELPLEALEEYLAAPYALDPESGDS